MAYIDFDILRNVQRWYSNFAAHRKELLTERHINQLPEHILRDIGWPDAYAERLAQRNSMLDTDIGATSTDVGLPPLQLDWTKHYEALKTRKSSPLELGC